MTGRRKRPRAERSGGEAGFTLVELMITTALLATVMAAIFGVLDSQTRTERRVQIFADNQEVLRQAIVAIQRDIRSSEPLQPLASSPDYALRIDLDVYDKITDPAPVPIRWIVDDGANELRREILRNRTDNPLVVTAVTYRLTGVSNDFGAPLFSFYSANSKATTATSSATTSTTLVSEEDLGKYKLVPETNPKDIASCAVRIRIDLLAAPTPGPAPARLISDAQLRNRLPGGTGCPVLNLNGVG